MTAPPNNGEVFTRFVAIAERFCATVDSAPHLNKEDLVLKIYALLPELIGGAIGLPVVESSDSTHQTNCKQAEMTYRQWNDLYSLLKEKLGNWDIYSHVFDPARDQEAIKGSLADDIADIYRDLKEGLVCRQFDCKPPDDILWEWRFAFYSHWGDHAISALRTIHSLLEPTLS